MAAEIGSMAVTEQIDAIRALGADPVKKLVVPRLIACVILIPVLALFADVVGFGGAMVVAYLQFDTPMGFFFRTALESINMQDFMSGLGKAPFFGVTTAMIGCYYGMQTRGGTEGRRPRHHPHRGRLRHRHPHLRLLPHEALPVALGCVRKSRTEPPW
jgi:phospholipid/cholesterol/gamma-HCH transport system permease protein